MIFGSNFSAIGRHLLYDRPDLRLDLLPSEVVYRDCLGAACGRARAAAFAPDLVHLRHQDSLLLVQGHRDGAVLARLLAPSAAPAPVLVHEGDYPGAHGLSLLHELDYAGRGRLRILDGVPDPLRPLRRSSDVYPPSHLR